MFLREESTGMKLHFGPDCIQLISENWQEAVYMRWFLMDEGEEKPLHVEIGKSYQGSNFDHRGEGIGTTFSISRPGHARICRELAEEAKAAKESAP